MAARGVGIAPPPRVTEAAKRSETPVPNIQAPSADEQKYINFRVDRVDFVDVKKAALDEGLTLGQYLMHTHRSYQAKKG